MTKIDFHKLLAQFFFENICNIIEFFETNKIFVVCMLRIVTDRPFGLEISY